MNNADQYQRECEECEQMEQDLKQAQMELIFWQSFGKEVLKDIQQMQETDNMLSDVPRTLLEMYRRFAYDLRNQLQAQITD